MQLQCLNDGAHLGVVDARELSPLLPGDHEGGEVGGVDGEEHHREQRPDRGHEPVLIRDYELFLYSQRIIMINRQLKMKYHMTRRIFSTLLLLACAL